ncbi:RagB/SusD family nutrient uptake outer membrane protein [Pontibacter sp. CAU 1760]
MRNQFYIKNKLKLALMTPMLGLSLMLVSCEKEVVELTPFDRITESTAFETPARVELSMAGVYDAAQSGFYAGGAVRGYPFGAAHVEQGDTRGEDMLNLAAFYQITYESTYSAATANNQYMWETLYSLINKANVVIEGVEGAVAKNVITADQGKAYIAECKFLRALAHHELVTHYARPYNHTADASHLGVPYRTTAVNTPARVEEASTKGRDTVKEVYKLILEDLASAELGLPDTRTTNKVTRATKAAAIALKARVNLHKRDWSAVVTESNKIVSAAAPFISPFGGYQLTATPEGPFANNKNNTESVFSIENSSADNAGTNGALPQMYSISPARGLVAISPIIWNQAFWPLDDLRRTQLTKQATTGYFFTNKYRDITTFSDNAPVIRYAEVLLNKAEAHARLNQPAEALALLNAVRGRATSLIYVGLSGNELVQAIINERRIEFLSEGLRWKDIHRLAVEGQYGPNGIPAKIAPSTASKADYVAASGVVRPGAVSLAAIPYDSYKFIWPLPLTEVAANPVLKDQQNPGY